MLRQHEAAADTPGGMEGLQNRWYNAVVRSLNLTSAAFQLLQPSFVVPRTDLGLWRYGQEIPQRSLTANAFDMSLDRFFDIYAAVVGQLNFPESCFKADIGDDTYEAWTAYLATLHPQPSAQQLPSLFLVWAMINAPTVANVGQQDLAEIALIGSAQAALEPYAGADGQPAEFGGSYAQLIQSLAHGITTSFSFDSRTASGDVSGSWTGGVDTVSDGLWSGAVPGNRQSLLFSRSHVQASVGVSGLVTWPLTPGPWYDSSIFATAYADPATPPWPDPAQPAWDAVFGADGSLPRVMASLAVAKGIDATVTSDAVYSPLDQAIIETFAPLGLWPFYLPSGMAQTTVSFGPSSGMTIRTVSAPGTPVVLGGNVQAIGPFLGVGAG
ncbi:hypothetical protein FBZ82_107234 [Azospirillum brasilense]|uniref:Uncharacterized protein n=1 Tax=Azospirillum brasilense TaxID=192 RepID=A0A560B3P6_AZOBR|nr:hypothetical protein [Azospirillum brasilense]TWA67258.1 hypothetical protein FBZ82_107234 [Azospirillum brasilense]